MMPAASSDFVTDALAVAIVSGGCGTQLQMAI
jgi:hypothetical protein